MRYVVVAVKFLRSFRYYYFKFYDENIFTAYIEKRFKGKKYELTEIDRTKMQILVMDSMVKFQEIL